MRYIYENFINSVDYNGLRLDVLFDRWDVDKEEGIQLVTNLIEKGDCIIQSSNNPYIIHSYIPTPTESIEFLRRIQADGAESSISNICVYPSQSYLRQHNDTTGMAPYAKRLALGSPQLKPLFFKFEVLKPYIDNPTYQFKLDDYSGSISYKVTEDTYVDKEGYYKLETFGLGMDEKGHRVIVSFPRYLRRLSLSQQNHWEAHEIIQPCRVFESYMRNIMEGNWSFPQSVSRGVVNERKYINNLWKAIFGDKLFLTDYSYEEIAREYPFIFMPTSKAFNQFIHFMDKFLSDDMNTKHLRKLLDSHKNSFRGIQEADTKQIRSLGALELWLDNIYTLKDGRTVGKEIVFPLRQIRKDRQQEAHKILKNNEYNLSYYERQMEIFEKIYESLKKLRIILSTHPSAQGVLPPNSFSDKVYLY